MDDKPFIKLLKSPYGFYFFDVNRNQVVRTSEDVFGYLEQWLESGRPTEGNKAIEKLERLGFLSSFHVKEIEHPKTPLLKDFLDSNMQTLVLQLTQECNFRCTYCIYSDNHNIMQRSHNSLKMDVGTARKAIDYFADHTSDTEFPYISFYGGEPLLEFHMMQELVAYAKSRFGRREIGFSFTTNGSLLNSEIVQFCEENDVFFMVSMDGPEKIHDISRRFAGNGKGSYQQIRKNLKYIREQYPQFWKRISVSMVLNQQNDYDEIAAIFEEEDFSEIRQFYLSDIDDIYSLEKTVFSSDFQEKENYHKFQAYVEYLEKGDYSGSDWIARNAVSDMRRFHDNLTPQRRFPDKSSPSGPCLPGHNRLFVNVNGDFFPCERVSELSEAVKIGDVDHGIDTEKAEMLLNIGKLSAEKCKKCWAFIHCNLCVRNADNCGKLSGVFRTSFCENVRETVEHKIMDYIMIKECKMGRIGK